MVSRNVFLHNSDGTSCFLNATLVSLFFPNKIRSIICDCLFNHPVKHGINDQEWLNVIYLFISQTHFPIFDILKKILESSFHETNETRNIYNSCMEYCQNRLDLLVPFSSNIIQVHDAMFNIYTIVDYLQKQQHHSCNPCKDVLNETNKLFKNYINHNVEECCTTLNKLSISYSPLLFDYSSSDNFSYLSWLFELSDLLRCNILPGNEVAQEFIHDIAESFETLDFSHADIWRRQLFQTYPQLLHGQQGPMDTIMAIFSLCGSEGIFQEDLWEFKPPTISRPVMYRIAQFNVLKIDGLPYLKHQNNMAIHHDISLSLEECVHNLDLSEIYLHPKHNHIKKWNCLCDNQDVIVFYSSFPPFKKKKTIFYGIWTERKHGTCILNIDTPFDFDITKQGFCSCKRIFYLLDSIICWKGNESGGHFIVWVKRVNDWFFNDCLNGEFIKKNPWNCNQWDPSLYGILFIYHLIQ